MEHAMSIERDHESERTSRIDRMVESLNEKPEEGGRSQRRPSSIGPASSDSQPKQIKANANE
jgi:hypothetical protein